MQWAAAELEHVGRIASVMDPDIQYAYAMSTLNGMAHLKDALYEMVTDAAYEMHQEDLQRTHDAVIRTMRHLKNEYGLDLDAIRAFNTKGTLSDLSYLEDVGNVENANANMSNNHNMPSTQETNAYTTGNRNTRSQLVGGKRRTRYRSRRGRRSLKRR